MQKDVFLNSEGDSWYDRNATACSDQKNNSSDKILDLIKQYKIEPENLLEIGCSDGWRLNLLSEQLNSQCFGIEPSAKAVKKGNSSNGTINIIQGTADNLPYEDNIFDLLIYGFCLYLCDREDLFKIVYEGDRVLRDGGHIIIQDFSPPQSYKNKYLHQSGIFSYKMDYSQIFLWNPDYFQISSNLFSHFDSKGIEDPDERMSIELLQKNREYAYPSVQY